MSCHFLAYTLAVGTYVIFAHKVEYEFYVIRHWIV